MKGAKTVYLVTFDPACITGGVPGEDERTLGVFSSRRKAQTVIDKYNTFLGMPKDCFSVKRLPLDKEIVP